MDAVPLRLRLRFSAWVLSCTLLVAGQIVWMVALRGERIFDHDNLLVVGQCIFGLAVIVVWILLTTTPADAVRLSPRASRWIIIGGAAALQSAAVALLLPRPADHLVRYRLDGRTWLSGVSAFSVSPNDMRRRAQTRNPKYAPDALDDTVWRPDLHTIQPPTAQAAFVVARLVEVMVGRDGIAAPSLGVPHHVIRYRAFAFRALFAAAAVGCGWALVSVLNAEKRSVWWAVLFAWNPLTTLQAGGAGFVDVLGVLFLLLCVRAARRREAVVAPALLALAAGVQPLAAVVAPFMARELARCAGARASRISLAAFVAFVAALFLPAILYHQGHRGFIATTTELALHLEANGSIYVWANAHMGHARLLAPLAAAVAVGLCLFFRYGVAGGGYWVILALLLASPVVRPSQLLWALSLAPLLGGRGACGITALTWAATAGESYLTGKANGGIGMAFEYAPVYLALAWEIASTAFATRIAGPAIFGRFTG